MNEHQRAAPAPPPRLGPLFLGMVQVAMSAFGGGLSAWSQRILVEQRRWLSQERFLTALTVARLLPGPNQVNMAIFIGAECHGWRGALVAIAGILVLPFTLLMGAGLVYFRYHQIAAVEHILAGVVAAAAGMALSMGFRILGRYKGDPMALVLASLSFIALSVLHVRLIPVVITLGPLAMAWYWPRKTST